MKKIFYRILLVFSILTLVSCTSPMKRTELRQRNQNLELKLSEIFVEGKTTRFEVIDLFGTPTVTIRLKDDLLRTAYYSGSFYMKASPENKKIIDKYLTEEFLNNPEKFKDVVIAIYYKHNDEKDEDFVYRVRVEQL